MLQESLNEPPDIRSSFILDAFLISITAHEKERQRRLKWGATSAAAPQMPQGEGFAKDFLSSTACRENSLQRDDEHEPEKGWHVVVRLVAASDGQSEWVHLHIRLGI